MTATTATPRPSRPGLGRRMLSWFRRLTPEVPPVNVIGGFTFASPARDDAFSFTVTVRCCWCARGGPDRGKMEAFVGERRRLDEQAIRRMVRAAVREFPPYAAKDAEDAANKTLTDDGPVLLGTTTREDMSATCTAWVEIDVAEPVRAYQEKEWRASLSWAAHAHDSTQAIGTLTKLRDEWLVFLGADPGKLTHDWRLPFAIRLAEHGRQVTETVASMHWRRRRDVTFAAGFYQDVIKQLRGAGHYDFAVSVEDLLRKMVKAYDLPRYDLVGEMLQNELLPYNENDPMLHVFGMGQDTEGPEPEMFGTSPGEDAEPDWRTWHGERLQEPVAVPDPDDEEPEEPAAELPQEPDGQAGAQIPQPRTADEGE
ncbi:hypothetical protein ACIBHY_01600 [Nonomuraea sp. NPDC050547]|uniref:hypothetical protein n=1 Tax=Nonomuraea sp. NPDC050547 TaxID=3364368 RepID=UPI0037BB0014